MTTSQGKTTGSAVYADLYLRLSDFRADDADSFGAREGKLRTEAGRLGWTVRRVVTENDVTTDGRRKPASAYKRQLVRRADGTPEMRFGRRVYRVLRPGWRSVLEDLGTGAAAAVLAEDLDRVARDPRDIEDLIDAVSACGGHARSLSGSLCLTDGGRSDELAMARVLTAMGAKSSADTARRVADGRERSALAGSYGGGRRPFGYRADPDAPKGAKTLTVVPEEAAILRDAATAILDQGVSLKAIARDLRDRGVPTVTGAPWTASTLRDTLAKPAVAGIAVHTGTVKGEETGKEHEATMEHPDAWPAILERDVYDRLRGLFESRKTGTGNEPRWLLSLIATCGVCGAVVKCTGSAARRGYTCTAHGHVRRAAVAVDEYVSAVVVERLSRPDVADLLRPPPRPGTDAVKLRSETRKLRDRKAAQMRMHAAGDIDDADLAAGMRVIRDRLAAVESQLAASDQPDPLAEFRDRPAAAVWESLTLPRKRAVVRLLMRVTILPAGRKGRRFDETSVRVLPVAGSDGRSAVARVSRPAPPRSGRSDGRPPETPAELPQNRAALSRWPA
jgi:site-specific DNA recombinase